MAVAELLGGAKDIEEVRMDRRLAAGELDQPPRNRLLRPVETEHLDNLLFARFVDLTGDIRVGEANGARQIAAVGQVDVAERSVTQMALTDPQSRGQTSL